MLQPLEAAMTTRRVRKCSSGNCTLTTARVRQTTKPIKLIDCNAGDCSIYDSRLRNFLSSAMSDDFISVLSQSPYAVFLTDGSELGDVFFKCGRIFFTSFNKAKFGDAALACAKRKMQLVAIEEGANNLQCLAPGIDDMALDTEKYFFIWTSAMAEGSNCRNAAYSWCAGSRAGINSTHVGLPSAVSRKERCVALSRMSKTLVRLNCATPTYYFCEYKCKSVTCLPSQACKLNATRFENNDVNGLLRRRPMNGFWAEWKRREDDFTVSYTTYIFGTKRMTWADSMKMCCSLGMMPIRVTDEFLFALNNVGNDSDKITIFYTPANPLKANTTEDRSYISTSFWTAATRQGCAGQYRFCRYDDLGPWDSQGKFWSMLNPRDTGSCLAIDRQYTIEGAPFGVRQVQCSSSSGNFACQKEGRIDSIVNGEKETKEERTNNTCQQPVCPFLQYCTFDAQYTATFENQEQILLKPYLLGEWKTACGVRYLIAKKEMFWDSALEYCCSLGMRLLTLQSVEKLACLDGVLSDNGSTYWTSGTNGGCSNKRFRWCSPEIKDFIKPSFNLDENMVNFNPAMNLSLLPPFMVSRLCVAAKKSATLGSILGAYVCMMPNKVICEGRVQAESHLQEVFNECKATHRVSQRDLERFNTVPLDSFSFRMKCLSTCVAELLGLIYDSGQFWEDVAERSISRVKEARALEDFGSVMKQYPVSMFKKAADNLDALKMMLTEQSKQETWKATLFVNNALDRFWECTDIVKEIKIQDECSFVHNFMKCYTNETTALEKFWTRNLDNVFDPREYALTLMKSMLQMMISAGQIEKETSYALPTSDQPVIQLTSHPNFIERAEIRESQKFVRYINPISLTDEYISSKCSFKLLRPKNWTSRDACLEIDKYLEPTPFEDALKSKALDLTKRFPAAVAAAICQRANGSLVTPDYPFIANLSSIAKNESRYYSAAVADKITDTIFGAEPFISHVLLDEIYQDSQGVYRWCDTSKVVPKEVTSNFAFSMTYVTFYDGSSSTEVRKRKRFTKSEEKYEFFGCCELVSLCIAMIFAVILLCFVLQPLEAETTTRQSRKCSSGNCRITTVRARQTTKPIELIDCNAGDCSIYDSRLRNFLSSAMSDDFISVLSQSPYAVFLTDGSELGDVFFKCGRIFFTSFNKAKFGDAVLACAKRKMQLVAIEEGANNMQCLAPGIDDMALDTEKYFFIWTSAMAEGSNCRNAAYSWCAGSRAGINSTHVGLPSAVSRKERCVALSRMSKTLVRLNCATPTYYFCEYKCKSVTCLPSQACKLNATRFENKDVNGLLRRRPMNGFWAEWKRREDDFTVSYTTYIFGTKRMTWADSMKMCCSLGMMPIRVTDEFLFALNNVGNEGNKITIFYTPANPLKPNTTEDRWYIKTSFWTAATRQGCAGQYRFCRYDDLGPWDSQGKFWSMLNPRDTGSCLAIDRQYTIEGAPFGVRQVQCSSPSGNFACQKEGRIDSIVNGEKETSEEKIKKNCDLPVCPDLKYCQFDNTNTAQFENEGQILLTIGCPRSVTRLPPVGTQMGTHWLRRMSNHLGTRGWS
ncbi:Hypothetical predicted protein [Cloeon dipterum]|uniref:C-type lectin domain-containing protein n=1 Tax=Cloeon dipterum TaxID=197152 RepID=A0A8S1DDH1_9INSE|nr:Hypothetical predicted protein [Cloeon dipterum]